MARYATHMRINPGREDEYREVHRNLPADFRAAMTEAGISNYSIFLDGLDVYSYLECDDLTQAMERLGAHPTQRRWRANTAHLLEPADPKFQLLDEVFHLEGSEACQARPR